MTARAQTNTEPVEPFVVYCVECNQPMAVVNDEATIEYPFDGSMFLPYEEGGFIIHLPFGFDAPSTYMHCPLCRRLFVSPDGKLQDAKGQLWSPGDIRDHKQRRYGRPKTVPRAKQPGGDRKTMGGGI